LTELFKQTLSQFSKNYFQDISDSIDEVIVGTAYPESEQGYNIARTCALGCRLDKPGFTVNRLCSSSLEALMIAVAKVNSGLGDCYLVGGVESMSRIPRRGANFSESALIKSAAPDTYVTMGETAENIFQKFKISREAQEQFSIRSHLLAEKAWSEGKYQDQIFAYLCAKDEGIRSPLNVEKLKALPPVFKSEGSVTAATSSPLSDGACAGFVVSPEFAKKISFSDETKPKGLKILDAAVSAVTPALMGMGPVDATKKLLHRNNLTVDDIDVFEMNEAFSVQSLACQKQLEIPDEKLNQWGGAIAIGHPLGASGLRLLMTCMGRLSEIKTKNPKGIVTLCVGGGQGVSVLVESL
jgi:acetyl-CoA acyltransferase